MLHGVLLFAQCEEKQWEKQCNVSITKFFDMHKSPLAHGNLFARSMEKFAQIQEIAD